MTKITLDELDYNTEDFNDEQRQLFSEITYNNNLQTQLRYQLQALDAVANATIGKLKESLTAKEE
jgi:hypothetical protein